MKVKDFLEDEILGEFDKLQDLDAGSEEHARAVQDICNMTKSYSDLEKLERDTDEKEVRREIEDEVRSQEFEEHKKEKTVDLVMNFFSMALPLWAYNVWMNRGFKFEEEGTYRSRTFTNLINKFKPNSLK